MQRGIMHDAVHNLRSSDMDNLSGVAPQTPLTKLVYCGVRR